MIVFVTNCFTFMELNWLNALVMSSRHALAALPRTSFRLLCPASSGCHHRTSDVFLYSLLWLCLSIFSFICPASFFLAHAHTVPRMGIFVCHSGNMTKVLLPSLLNSSVCVFLPVQSVVESLCFWIKLSELYWQYYLLRLLLLLLLIFLCLCQHDVARGVMFSGCSWVCPCIWNVVNTLSWKVLDVISPNFQHWCIWDKVEHFKF